MADHCLRSEDYVNVIVSDKQPHLVYLDMEAAIVHCTKGVGIWDWASNDQGIGAGRGDRQRRRHPHAGSTGRRRDPAEHLPDLKIRFVNVVDLYRFSPIRNIRTGCPIAISIRCLPQDKPVIFNFHGYPWLIHKFTYRRTNHANIHVRGYKEKGNINTPLELAIRNQVDRFDLAIDVIDRVPRLQGPGATSRNG